MEYYTAIKREKVLIHATMWMNLENIMFHEKTVRPKSHKLHDSVYTKCPELENP